MSPATPQLLAGDRTPSIAASPPPRRGRLRHPPLPPLLLVLPDRRTASRRRRAQSSLADGAHFRYRSGLYSQAEHSHEHSEESDLVRHLKGIIKTSLQSFRFRFVLSPLPTRAALLYLKKCCKWARTEELDKLNHIEVCPGALDLTRAIAKRISADGGGALIIDYGTDGIVSDSLQFLGCLEINFCVEALLQNCTDEQAESLRNGYWQLVGNGEAPFWEKPDDQTPIGMGSRYLAMAVVNKLQGVPVPLQ